jgi:outer membrane protein assembly factor BamB
VTDEFAPMDKRDRPSPAAAFTRRAANLTRRSALVLPLAGLSGCSLFEGWLGEDKPPIPGKREPVLPPRAGLDIAADAGKPNIVLPPPVSNADWPQAGGNPAHLMGHLATAPRLREAWSVSIGSGGGYRRKITAQPVVAGGTVYTMDSDALVRAFDLARGRRRWEFDTQAEDDRSFNVGGGLGFDDGVLYASTGRAELLALDPATGKPKWRKPLPGPARSAPTIAEGRVFVTTIEDELVAFQTKDGARLWSFRAANPSTQVLGQPAPAYSDGFVVGGFGSGEIASLRAISGGPAWTDNLSGGFGSGSLIDISAVRGLPVIADGLVYAIGMGGLMLANDLRSGRRLWERQVAGEDSPWLAGDWLFVISLGQKIAAVSRQTGKVAWVTQLPAFDNPEKQRDPIYWLGPLLAGDRLVAVGTNAEAIAASPYTGAILGRQPLSGRASVAPVLASGTLLVVTDDGTLLALR